MKSSGQAAAIALLLGVGLTGELRADDEVMNPGLSAEALETSISATMTQKKYQWQLSRRLEEALEADSERSWLAGQLVAMGASLSELVDNLSDWIEKAFKRLERQDSSSTSDKEKGSEVFDGIQSVLSIGMIILVIVLGVWLSLVLYRKYRSGELSEEKVQSAAEFIDLRSEDIVASELPEDEWLKLAREQMEKGDRRLAVRALYLASLAKLGDEELVRIARFKSNLDYCRELQRKAWKWTEMIQSLKENTRDFERAWYGWHDVTDEVVDSFLRNHELIVKQSEKAGKSGHSALNKVATAS